MLVISPLNTLIHDQIVKMREGGLNVCVLKGDRVTGDDDRDDVALRTVEYNIRPHIRTSRGGGGQQEGC